MEKRIKEQGGHGGSGLHRSLHESEFLLGRFRGCSIVMGGTEITGSKTIIVSRWGREGLESGDFVMKGRATRANYIKSGKWQAGMANEQASYSSGREFIVPKSTLKPPDKAATAALSDKGVMGWFKYLFGERSYRP